MGERDMRQLRDVVRIVGLAGLLVGCASVTGTSGGPARPTVTPRAVAQTPAVSSLSLVSTPVPSGVAVSSPLAAPSSPTAVPGSPTAALPAVPTIFETPTVTPTLGP